MLRSPVVCILAHVDHGKTSILDRIRGTAVASKEAGGITQMIGAYYLPIASITALCGGELERKKISLRIPGLLFIDTPGHEAFTSMRERGGSIADIAILVIDVNQGIQPQTVESIKILKQNRTPFIVALNKIDMVDGWKAQEGKFFIDSLEAQSPLAQSRLDDRLYSILGKLSEMGFESERFDRVTDFTKQLVLVPCSAKSGEGIPDLILFLAGLSQRFLEKTLVSEANGPAKGSIIELKDEKGLGVTIDVIVYDGTLRKNVNIVYGTQNGVATTKVRAILRPPHPGEKINAGEKFVYMDEIHAAAGVKIYAPGLENALAGSPVMVVEEGADLKTITEEINSQIKNILVQEESAGVIVRTDTLGSAEAFSRILAAAKIPIKAIRIGPLAKKDIIDAHAVAQNDKYLGVVLAFNVPVPLDINEAARDAAIPVFSSPVIYHCLEEYQRWSGEEKKRDAQAAITSAVLPAKIRVMPNCFFRLSKPAVFGVEVLEGRLRSKAILIDANGNQIGSIKQMQAEAKPVEIASPGTQLAISVDEAYCGKSFKAGDVLYTYINKQSANNLRENAKSELSSQELVLLDQIVGLTSGSLI